MSFLDPYSADDIDRRRNNWFNPRIGLEKIFRPRTDRFEVSGTKNQIQLGTLDGEWGSVLLVDNKVIRACIFRRKDLNKLGLPNFYYLNRWLMRTVGSRETNPHELIKTIKRMLDQLMNLIDKKIEVNFDAFTIESFLIDGKVWLFPEYPQIRRSSKKGFQPLSSQLGVPGTSVRIQLGRINGRWASRLLKGNDLIDSHVYKDEDLSVSGFPNQNLIVGWVLRTIAIPNINPHQIMKTVQVLTKLAIGMREIPKNEEDDSRQRIADMANRLRALRDGDKLGDDRFSYPYVYKPPQPPDDLGLATNAQLKKSPKEVEPEVELFCRYCGSELSMDERFCSVCGKKS